MQRLIKSWGKDQVVNIGQRANLYKTIRRLHEAGLIAVRQTERAQQYPERTVYELTDDGRRTGLRRVLKWAFHQHQGGPRGAAGRGQNLHDLRAIHDRQRRLALEHPAHTRSEAVFWRHLFSAGPASGPAQFSRSEERRVG